MLTCIWLSSRMFETRCGFSEVGVVCMRTRGCFGILGLSLSVLKWGVLTEKKV